MAELLNSVGNLGLTLLTALGVSCGGSTAVEAGGTGGSIATGGGSFGGAGGASALPYPPACTNVSDAYGYSTCSEGWTHRSGVTTCSSSLPRADYVCAAGSYDLCKTDVDCAATANSYCSSTVGAAGCYCATGCVSDADCAANSICQCGDPVGHCVTASCRSDAECPGGFCATYDSTAGCGGLAFACTTPRDECHSGSDCAAGYCVLASDGHRVCASPNCVIGRPFLVAGTDRLAPSEQRCDWAAAGAGFFDTVRDREQRERLFEHYRQVALMEHASVAAFARLSLQLMSLGAPSELVRLSIQAQGDELEHARLAFGLANELSPIPLGPGALSIEGALDETSIEHIAFTAVIEGCVGETVAAAEATEASARAANPGLRALFERIARDETRHAELSYRVVSWLLEVGGASVRRAVARGFQAAIECSPAARRTKQEDANFGALDAALADEVRTQALRQIVTPAAAHLGFGVAVLARAA